MDNKEIAAIFGQIANILELKEENPFRIRSYRRVEETLSNVGFDISKTAVEEPEKLRALPGVGEATFKKILELVETGACEEHQQLLSEVPESLLTLLELQNLGPKKIALFWRDLGITTLEELEQAAASHQLRSLSGMGEKSEAKILQAIDDFRRREGRVRLDRAMEISQTFVAFLKDSVEVERVDVAGSVRRRRETIGDIDILVSCQEPAEVIEAFVSQPSVREILAKGGTKGSIVVERGIQVDLRVVSDQSFGAALQYFTGSKQHNVALRERAKRLGYKINEYGLFEVATGDQVAGYQEKEIYNRLQLDYIPPELREDQGEIAHAELQRLPKLIELDDFKGDLHMHTTESDGKNSLEEMIEAGRDAGYEFIAITDHSQALAMIGGLNEDELVAQIQRIKAMRPDFSDIEVLTGIEVDVLADGSLDMQDEVLEMVDVVIASVHSRFSLSQKEMTARICRALEHPAVNILAHPTGRLILRREPYQVDLEEVARCAIDNRVSLEINAYPARLDLNDVHARMVRDKGALLSINTDAHSVSMLDLMLYGVDTARRGWLEAEDVINTYSCDRLRKVLRKESYR
jgi:DNA polymerase (family 10)